jgi:uncharacterized protein (DUF2147 family)
MQSAGRPRLIAAKLAPTFGASSEVGMRRSGFLLAALVAAPQLLAPPAGAADAPRSYGLWRNPKGSVNVEIRSCGTSICGYVVWANEKAIRDAREGGTEELIGLQLFSDFVQTGPGRWKGKVFVPDLNRTFAGTAERIDDGHIRAKGCVVPIIACKAQVWVRLR